MNWQGDELTRRAYLDALGIDAWQLRGADADALMAETVDAASARVTEPPLTPNAGVPAETAGLAKLRRIVAECRACALHESRTQTVFGVGNPTADWMIIGEAPGAEEDRRGEPFVGRAGKLLDEMLRAIGLDRNTAFIANILKCRPPQNRDPSAEEAASCRTYLDRQIELVAPQIILAVGRIAAQQLLGTDMPVGRMRGRVFTIGPRQIPTIVTYHPAYLLRSPSQKGKVWQDLCLAKQSLPQ
ncbi:MAG: uracil-DNA glycosylase [Pseudomonadota bacterium]